MGVTSKLLALYRVDQQLKGLKGRLQTAERYLKRQEHQIREIDDQLDAVRSQLRQIEATNHNDETQIKSMDERIEMLRERANNAQTSKEHSALLTEISTIKADRSQIEDRVLEHVETIERLRGQEQELVQQRDEREKIRAQAEGDRDARASEIKDRLAELESEREQKAADVPADAMAAYNERVDMGMDEVMCPVHEEDRRNMVYISEASNQALPIELVNKLLLREGLVIDPFSDAILYMPDDLRESLEDAAEKKRKKREAAAK